MMHGQQNIEKEQALVHIGGLSRPASPQVTSRYPIDGNE
jgi:hypothetical protein